MRIYSVSGHSEAEPLRALADLLLEAKLKDLVRQERENVADIVEHLLEMDRRDLALARGFPSLFEYCVKALGYSEAAAFVRIRAARAVSRFPEVLGRLRSGRIHLDAVARLSPHLTQENQAKLLSLADGASKREVLSIVASLQEAEPPARDVVLPVAPDSSTRPPVPLAPAEATPEVLPPVQHRFHFTANAELLTLVERLRGLLRHKHPYGRLEDIFKEACDALLDRLEKDRRPLSAKISTGSKSAKVSRRIPAAIRRAVWARDAGRCAFVSADGRRCGSRDALEYDHIKPWACGGRSDEADNIRLLCRAHNQALAKRVFGLRHPPEQEKATPPY